MNLIELWEHPVTQALLDGARYTTPKVMAALKPKPVTEDDIQQAAAATAEPVFDEPQPIQEVTP